MILTTVAPHSPAGALIAAALGRASDVRMFGVDEVVRALADRRLEFVFHRAWGIAQMVCVSRLHER